MRNVQNKLHARMALRYPTPPPVQPESCELVRDEIPVFGALGPAYGGGSGPPDAFFKHRLPIRVPVQADGDTTAAPCPDGGTNNIAGVDARVYRPTLLFGLLPTTETVPDGETDGSIAVVASGSVYRPALLFGILPTTEPVPDGGTDNIPGTGAI